MVIFVAFLTRFTLSKPDKLYHAAVETAAGDHRRADSARISGCGDTIACQPALGPVASARCGSGAVPAAPDPGPVPRVRARSPVCGTNHTRRFLERPNYLAISVCARSAGPEAGGGEREPQQGEAARSVR